MEPPITIRVRDAYGNAVTGAQTKIVLTLGQNPSNAQLSGTTSQSFADSQIAFGNLRIIKAGNGYTLKAQLPGLPPIESPPFNVVPGPPARLAFAEQPTTSGINAVISPPVLVTVLDSVGNVVTDYVGTVTLALNMGNLSTGLLRDRVPPRLLGTDPISAVQGIAAFTDLSITAQGTGFTVTATAPNLASETSQPFDVTLN